jgi:hypothetical protein
LEKLSHCPCKESGVSTLAERDAMTATVVALANLDKTKLNKLATGLIRLDSLYDNADAKNYQLRKSNAAASIAIVEKIIAYSSWVKLLDARTDLDHFITATTEIHQCLVVTKRKLSHIIGNYSDVFDYYSDGLPSSRIGGAYGSSSSLDFMNTAKASIVPDFGFVGVIKGGKNSGIETVVPYLGFNVNLRPIDKSIPLKMVLYKSWRYKMTLTTGFTLTSLKINNQRDDLFSSYNLLLGVGYRINNYVKFSCGAVVFKSLSLNPLSSQTKLGSLPYVGITVDYDIVDLFNGLSKLFK